MYPCFARHVCRRRIADSGHTGGYRDEYRWDKYEDEVGHDRYPASFIDSIKQAKGFGDYRGLGPPVKIPYTREKLVFDGGWGFLRAGWAILIGERDTVDTTMFHQIGKVFSNAFVSTFYKVRDYVHSHTDYATLYPILFEQHIQEGRYTDHRWTLFDHRNRMVYNATKKGEQEIAAEPGIQNYLSLLYILRTMDLVVGDTVIIRCHYHRKDYPIRLFIRRKCAVEVPAGKFDCFEIEPQLVGTGRGFNKGDKLIVWLTDDEYRTPVLVKAKINIGSLSARLLYMERE